MKYESISENDTNARPPSKRPQVFQFKSCVVPFTGAAARLKAKQIKPKSMARPLKLSTFFFPASSCLDCPGKSPGKGRKSLCMVGTHPSGDSAIFCRTCRAFHFPMSFNLFARVAYLLIELCQIFVSVQIN